MSDNDRVEWRLFATNLTTQLAILPAAQGHLYFEFQEPGSGELRIPLDSTAASQITEGMFAMLYYRGAARGGFFIDNIKEITASEGEGGGRWMSISGRGPLALLDEVIVWDDGTGASTRSFPQTTLGAVLWTLIDERFNRGTWAQFDLDFSVEDDSDSVAWANPEDIELTVGTTLLDVLRDFASTGAIEFEINFISPCWTLSARQGGIGSDKSNDQFFRIGMNCQEVSEDERGGSEIRNSYLAKFRDGFTTASDSTSITARRRREKFLNLEVAQSGDSAQTFAAAKLALTKDPKTSISVRVYDGVAPYLFVDYALGDTLSLDRFGSEVSYRVLGIQSDFNGDDYSNVVVELNSLHYENELRMNRDLDWLLKQWNTAKDANQQEVKQWMSIGQPNGEVYALHYYDGYLYVGGDFTQITGAIGASYIARYNTETGAWEAMGTTITQIVRGIINVGTDIFCITTDKIYEWGGSSWTLRGTATIGASGLKAIATDGTSLYVGGIVVDAIGAVSLTTNIGKWNGSVWTSVHGTGDGKLKCQSLIWYDGALYAGFSEASTEEGNFQVFTTAWDNVFTDIPGAAPIGFDALAVVGENLALLDSGGTLYSWDGSASEPTILGDGDMSSEIAQDRQALAAYLSDIFIGAQFTDIGSLTDYNNIARYSGGFFSRLGTGFSIAQPDPGRNDKIQALAVGENGDLYAGGLFTTADGKSIANLAVWITSFESLVNHLSHDSRFDLAAAIHQATASAITDSDEMGFWEDVSNALRKITWANIKATLKTYFDTLYQAAATFTEDVQDIVGGMVSEAGIGSIIVTYNDTTGKLEFAFANEAVQDVVGAMVTGNTETGITVTYQDDDGTLDFDAQTAGDARYAPIANHALPGGRLSLTTGVPVTTSDVTGATTVYYIPYLDNVIELWDGSVWKPVTFSEVSTALGTLTAALGYDVFGYLDSGALALEKLAWSSATARATAITLQDGRYCKSGDKSRLYLGSFYTTATTTTEDSVAKRFLFNMYNRCLRKIEQANGSSHNYNTATVRAFNNDQGGSDVEYFIGLIEDAVNINASGQMVRASTDGNPRMAIGINSTTTETFVFTAITAITGRLKAGAGIGIIPTLGYSYVVIQEFSTAGTAPGTLFEFAQLSGVILA